MSQPLEIRLRADKKTLSIAFSAVDIFEYSAELLRVESPSAEIKGHGSDEKKIVGGKKNVTIVGIEPMGHYAITITFSDGHKTGIYSWDYLKEMGRNMEEIWHTYLQNLEQKNLTRES